MGMIGDFYVRLSAMTAPYTAGLIEATDEGEAFAEANRVQMDAVKESNEAGGESFGLLSKAAVGIGVAFIGASAISMKWATSFQSTMETLHTQAGVAQSQISSLGNGVLSLAGQVGFDPDSLAEALYHIESSFSSVGITGSKAMELLQTAAEGAKVGHANLVDVTNALDAAVASGIPGVQNFSQAMGVLNATVGAGDMEMQDLANAFSTGLLANVKSYGLSITDVGAALATFGDNNIRGQNAATDLRMAVQAMAVPAATAAGELQKMGLSTDSLAKVMSKQGLLPALELLKQKMTAIGVTTQTQGMVLTDLFGKKAGAGITVLYDQLDRLKSKYPELQKGADQFGNAWTSTKATVKQQLDDIGAAFQAAGIRFGQFLLPQAEKLLSFFTTKGGALASSMAGDFSQIGAGFTGNLPKQAAGPDMPAPKLDGWQQAGVEIRKVADDFQRFGKDVVQASEDAVLAAKPVAQVFSQGLGLALIAVGKILANLVGPALKDVFGFLADHQSLVRVFAEVILTGLIIKLSILGTMKSATAITDLASSILNFPKNQLDAITSGFGRLKASWLGKADASGNMVGSLKNAILSMGNTMRGAARTALGWGKSIGSGIAGGLSSATGKIGSAIKGILPTKLDAKIFLQSVKDLGGQAASTIKGWGGAIADAAADAATGLGNITVAAGQAIASFAGSAWAVATDTLSTLGTAIATAATAVWGWVASAGAATLAAGRAALAWTVDKLALIGTAVAESAAAAAQFLLDAAMDANPITLIIIAIVALIAIFVALWVKCAWFRDFWKSLWSDIKKLFDDAVTFIKGHVDLLVAVIALPMLPLTLLLQHWRQVWSAIKQASGDVWHWLDSNVIQPIGHWFSSTIGAALATAKSLWNSAWNGIESTVKTVWGVISPILNTISSAVSTVTSGVSGLVSKAGSIGGSVVHDLNPMNWFEDGGFVPGATGSASLAVVHGGEYVLSTDMLAGRAPIDRRVLSGTLSTGSRGGGSASALAVGSVGSSGGSVTVITVNVQVAGNVTSEKKLADTVRTQILQYAGRNSNNGLNLNLA